jgi:hypothetical protein
MLQMAPGGFSLIHWLLFGGGRLFAVYLALSRNLTARNARLETQERFELTRQFDDYAVFEDGHWTSLLIMERTLRKYTLIASRILAVRDS